MATKARSETQLSSEVWNSLYVLLGFILAIAGDAIQMLELEWQWSLLAYAAVGVVAIWLILFNRPVQLWLNKLRMSHQEAWR
jgi:hypothetical protein